MKVIIDISEKMFKATQTYYGENITRLSIKTCIEKIANGTPIPNNATNGDIIKAMFPNLVNSNLDLVDVLNNAKSWWDAPYKRGDENG